MAINNGINDSANNLFLTGTLSANGSHGNSGDVLTSQGSSSPALWAPISMINMTMTWTVMSGTTTTTLVPNNGYFCFLGFLGCYFDVPTNPAVGDTSILYNIEDNSCWKLILITTGSNIVYNGVTYAGGLTAVSQGCCAYVVYVGKFSGINTWYVVFNNGTLYAY